MKLFVKNISRQDAAKLIGKMMDVVIPERPKKKSRRVIIIDPDAIQEATILGEEEVQLR